MDGSIKLSPGDRQSLLALYRNAKSVRASRRVHVILLLEKGCSWRIIISSTLDRFLQRCS